MSDATILPLAERSAERPVHVSLAAEEVPGELLRPCDVLLFRRGRSPISYLIAQGGRTHYSHAAMLGRWDDDWMVCETKEWVGGRSVKLSRYVDALPGRIDVYRLRVADRGRFRADLAMQSIRDSASRPYGWPAVLWVGFRRLAIVRLIARPDLDDQANGHHPFCSMAVSRALRAGGVDPVPNLADRMTEPGDLARSAALRYQFTLLP